MGTLIASLPVEPLTRSEVGRVRSPVARPGLLVRRSRGAGVT
jgi:hypothetical protein